jgi:hypothetical protein
MENLPKHKYVIWFDADAIVNNFDIPISNFINKYPQANLIACYDIYKEKECMNSGIMIIKNTEWSNNLFKKTWESTIPHGYNDQNAIFYTLIEDLYPGTTQTLKNNKYCTLINDSKVVLLEENAFNTNIQSYRPGDFIIHLMGVSKEGRINCMRQVNTALGLDNYDKKECINLINKYTGTDKIEKIRDVCLTKNI